MTAAPRTTAGVLEIFVRHDALHLYDKLEPWQQQELLCIVRRVCRDIEDRCRAIAQRDEVR